MLDLKEKIFFTILFGSLLCLFPCMAIAILYKYEMPLLIDMGIILACIFIALIKVFIEIWKN